MLSWSGEPESLGVLGEEQNGAVMGSGELESLGLASVMALGESESLEPAVRI